MWLSVCVCVVARVSVCALPCLCGGAHRVCVCWVPRYVLVLFNVLSVLVVCILLSRGRLARWPVAVVLLVWFCGVGLVWLAWLARLGRVGLVGLGWSVWYVGEPGGAACSGLAGSLSVVGLAGLCCLCLVDALCSIVVVVVGVVVCV